MRAGLCLCEWDQCPYGRGPRELPVPTSMGGHGKKTRFSQQEADPHHTPNLPGPWSWASNPQSGEEQNLLIVQVQRMVVVLEQPRRTTALTGNQRPARRGAAHGTGWDERSDMMKCDTVRSSHEGMAKRPAVQRCPRSQGHPLPGCPRGQQSQQIYSSRDPQVFPCVQFRPPTQPQILAVDTTA